MKAGSVRRVAGCLGAACETALAGAARQRERVKASHRDAGAVVLHRERDVGSGWWRRQITTAAGGSGLPLLLVLLLAAAVRYW